MSTFHPTREEVDTALDEADALRGRFLDEHGWKYSSNYPDSRWYWSKEINDHLFVMNAKDAYRIESYLDN